MPGDSGPGQKNDTRDFPFGSSRFSRHWGLYVGDGFISASHSNFARDAQR